MKIVIAGHDLKFIKFYIDYLKNSNNEVKIDHWESHTAHNIKESFDLINWADVVFCEWGLGNSVFYSKNKKKGQKLIVRLHRQELETNYLTRAKIENIDKFITVSPYIYEEFSRKFTLPREKMQLIYNNIDLNKFTNKDFEKRKFHIGMVGYLPKLKRLDLALDIFEELYKKDNRYHIHFKGKKPEELRWLWRIDDEREFYNSQFKRIESAEWKDNVIFEPFGDVVDFYNKIEIILSVSDIESFHLAAAEGMSCGAIPVISNWEGSDTIYNSTFILDDLNNIAQYIEVMRNNDNTKALLEKEVIKFDQEIVINEINSLVLN